MSSENKDADQLRGYREADLRLCFRICKKLVFSRRGSYVFEYFRYMNRPVMSAPGLYDPTTIMNADQLNRAMKEGWVKLAFYLISFFYYLYR